MCGPVGNRPCQAPGRRGGTGASVADFEFLPACGKLAWELQIQNHTRNHKLAGVPLFRSSHKSVSQSIANFGIGTPAAASRQRGQMTLRPGLSHGLIAAAAMLSFSSLAQAQPSSERIRVAQAPGGGGAQPTLLGTMATGAPIRATAAGARCASR